MQFITMRFTQTSTIASQDGISLKDENLETLEDQASLY